MDLMIVEATTQHGYFWRRIAYVTPEERNQWLTSLGDSVERGMSKEVRVRFEPLDLATSAMGIEKLR